ncbi:MAG: ABC transporter ATP-binding protein, partial [Spirochaetaceae bacterium]|nr:ABC transporter ATP-binding protein [Spirochaetaceae bacterium]
MAEYFETEEVVKGYDRGIAGRILSYVKPYRALAIITTLALIVSTLGELFIPVLEQRLIDGAILARFFAISAEAAAREERNLDQETRKGLDRLLSAPRALRVQGFIFIPQDQNIRISGRLDEALRARGILMEDQWYGFSLAPGDPAGHIVEDHREFFIREGDTAAIRTRDLYSLSVSEIRSIRGRDLSHIFRVVLFLFFILVLVFIFTFIQTWTTSLIGQRVMKDMRLELFRKTAAQSTDFLSRHPVGRIVTRLTGDVETINEFFSSVLVAFIKDLSVMVGALITLFLLSPKLAAVVLLTMSPVAVITAISRVRARDAFRRQRIASSRVNAYLSERLSGVQVVQLFLGKRKSLEEFGERNQEYLRANLEEMYVFAIFRPLIDFLATITTATVIVAGASMILSLSLSLGVLIAFINLVGMFYAPVMDIAEKYTLLQSAMAGGERVFKLLDTHEEIPNQGEKSVEGMVRGHVEFENVRFSYKKGEEILRGLSFTVNPGEMA